ncbi:MAG: hypothetical protein OEN56_02730 [Gemmatimonadota bacterium]|nr:hypothetical protein [Gemmatimonadota bacterium]
MAAVIDRLDRVPGRLPTLSGSPSRRDFLRLSVAGLLPAWAAACIPEPTTTGFFGVEPDPARMPVRPHAPTLPAPMGASQLDFVPTGRDGILYVPDGYDAATPAPLLVTLHGRARSADDWVPFYPKCDERGIVMLAVDSRGVTWDRADSGSFGPDVAFINGALDYVFDRCLIDTTRIALAGFSDGASYALSLGPSNGELFTHLIAFSPGFSAPGPQPIGFPLIWISHGIQDPVLTEEYTRYEMVPDLRIQGYTVQYVRFEGGHEVPAAISNAALDWFVS